MILQKKVWILIAAIFGASIIGSITYSLYIEGSRPKATTTVNHFSGKVDDYQLIIWGNGSNATVYSIGGEKKRDMKASGVLATEYAIFYYQNENGKVIEEEEDAHGNISTYELPEELIVPHGRSMRTFSLSPSGRYLYVQQERTGADELIGILYDRQNAIWQTIPLEDEMKELPDERQRIIGGWIEGRDDVLSISVLKRNNDGRQPLRAQFSYTVASGSIENEMNEDVQIIDMETGTSNFAGVLYRNAIDNSKNSGLYWQQKDLEEWEKEWWPEDKFFEKKKDSTETIIEYVNRKTGERKEVLRWRDPGEAHKTYAQFLGRDTGIAVISVHGMVGLLDIETGDFAELLHNKSEHTITYIIPPVSK